jgi:hypothetical protein
MKARWRVLPTLTALTLLGPWLSAGSAQDAPQTPREPLQLSFGVNIRERVESNHAEFLGTVPGDSGEWLLQRLELLADLRLGSHIRVIAQMQSALGPGKQILIPVDRYPLDLEQAFIAITEPVAGGTLVVRLGRQLMAFDLQRFVSLRDVPNLHQPYDAAEAEYRHGGWQLSAAYTQPVQISARDRYYSSSDLTFGGVHIERRLAKLGSVSGYVARFTHNDAVFAGASGNERRNVFDVRLAGSIRGVDWDAEAMHQTGSVGAQIVQASAVGSSVGYTIASVAWTPRIGLGGDAASGDRNPGDTMLQTFNPLFPNGFYLANYTGYVNLIHIKPSVTVHPRRAVQLMVAAAGQWRETIWDAVYVFPAVPLSGTVGTPGRHTGTYVQTHADATLTSHVSVGFDATYYAVGGAIRRAGGRNSTYIALEVTST